MGRGGDAWCCCTMDNAHIRIVSPRKGLFSINVQGVCGPNLEYNFKIL